MGLIRPSAGHMGCFSRSIALIHLHFYSFSVCMCMNVTHARSTAMTKYGVAAEIMCVCAHVWEGRVPLTVWTRAWCGKVG